MRVTHETERTDLWSKSSIGTRFTTGGPQVDDFDFAGILEEWEDQPNVSSIANQMLTNFGAIVEREPR